jgi:DHA3 family macrolide efflux protein-like MFS transporter
MAPFFTIWSGQAVSLLGSMLVQFALVWWLTETTDSATVLAIATLVAVLPSVFIAPFAGALVDRRNRRVVMIIADGTIALATVALAYIFYIGKAQPWHVYVIMFIRSTAGGFHWPAMQASTSLMVPEGQLSRIAGLNRTLQGLMNIAAPPIGAILLEVVPLQGVLAIDVVTALVAILPLLFIAIPEPERKAPQVGGKPTLLQDMGEGLAYVRSWPGLMAIGVMAMVINFLLTPASSLQPLLVTRHFGGGALELGWLQSGWGIGVVVGGLILSAWGGFDRRILTSLIGLIGMGLGLTVIGFVPASALWMAIGAMFLAGGMNPIVNAPLMAIVQAKVAPDMQGRVFSLMQSTSTAMMPIGLAVAGPLSDLVGVRVWYVVGGVICALMGIGAFFIPAVINMEENNGADRVETPCQPVPVPALVESE